MAAQPAAAVDVIAAFTRRLVESQALIEDLMNNSVNLRLYRTFVLGTDALKRVGVDDVNLVMVDAWSAGHYGNEPPEDRGKRLSRALCWVRSQPDDNGYARPLEGIVAVVDLNRKEVLRIEDYGAVPLPPQAGNWARNFQKETRSDLRPLGIVQPDGPSFTVSGQQIHKYEIGQDALPLHRLLVLASICGVPPQTFWASEASPEQAGETNASDVSVLQLVRSYRRINSATVRNRLLKLVKQMARNDRENTIDSE